MPALRGVRVRGAALAIEEEIAWRHLVTTKPQMKTRMKKNAMYLCMASMAAGCAVPPGYYRVDGKNASNLTGAPKRRSPNLKACAGGSGGTERLAGKRKEVSIKVAQYYEDGERDDERDSPRFPRILIPVLRPDVLSLRSCGHVVPENNVSEVQNGLYKSRNLTSKRTSECCECNDHYRGCDRPSYR